MITERSPTAMPEDSLTNRINCLAEVLSLSADDVIALTLIARKLGGSADLATIISAALDIIVANNIRNNQLIETVFNGTVDTTTSAQFAIPQGKYIAILCDGSLTVNQFLDANDTWQDMAVTLEPGEQMMCVGALATITTVAAVNITIIRTVHN